MATSDRTRELARKYLIRRDSRFERESYMPECFDELVALLDAFERETTEALRKALRDVLELLDEGKLVRDISHDHESDWAIKQLPMIRTLANATKLAAQPTPEVKK